MKKYFLNVPRTEKYYRKSSCMHIEFCDICIHLISAIPEGSDFPLYLMLFKATNIRKNLDTAKYLIRYLCISECSFIQKINYECKGRP